MSASTKDQALAYRLTRAGIDITEAGAATLRRAEGTLHRWHEGECGGDSWCIERDEDTGKTYRVYYGGRGDPVRTPIRDAEMAALRRVEAVCKARGLYWYQQGDPRGCALYVGREPLTGANYSSAGVPCCGEG